MSELNVELTLPQFVVSALGQRLAVRVDQSASGVPSFVASVDGDTMINEPRTDSTLDLIDAAIEHFPILDQRAKFAVRLRGHVNRFEFIHGRHPSQLECIVAVGLAFDIGPLPGFFVGRTHKGSESQRMSQITNPSRRTTGFHDDQIDLVIFEYHCQVMTVRSRIEEGVFTSI